MAIINNHDESGKLISRRSFLKSTAALGLAGAASSVPVVGAFAAKKKPVETPPEPKVTREFTFRNGRFKVLQLTDTHYIKGDERSVKAKNNVIEMLETEKPDLVIHTGDVISDGNPGHKIDALACMQEVLGFISEREIPFAVALGNHDGQFSLSREEMFKAIKEMPYNINKGVDEIYGDSNDVITLTTATGETPRWVLYLFDSGDSTSLKNIDGWSYDYIHFDQIGWYRGWAERFKAANNGTPIPALAFFHIPTPEFAYALRDNKRIFKGNLGEEPCPPSINSGLFTNFREMGDVMAISCGHDHDNDYAMKWKEMFLMYGRYSGGDTVYNNLRPNGARVFEFTEDNTSFRSWIREFGGRVTQDMVYPDAFRKF